MHVMWYAPFKNQSSVRTRIEGRWGGGGGYGVIPEKNYAPGKRGSMPAVNFLLEPKSSSKLFLKMFSMLLTGDRLNLHKVFI